MAKLDPGILSDPNLDLDDPAARAEVETTVEALESEVADLRATGAGRIDPAELDALHATLETLLARVREYRAHKDTDDGEG